MSMKEDIYLEALYNQLVNILSTESDAQVFAHQPEIQDINTYYVWTEIVNARDDYYADALDVDFEIHIVGKSLSRVYELANLVYDNLNKQQLTLSTGTNIMTVLDRRYYAAVRVREEFVIRYIMEGNARVV